MGFMENMKKKAKEGKLKTYARWIAIAGIVWLFLAAGGTFPFVTAPIPNNYMGIIMGIYGILLGLFLCFVELPFCCVCFEFCRRISQKLKVLEKYPLRGAIYSVLALAGILMHIPMAVFTVSALSFSWLFINGILYIAAGIRGEKQEEDDASLAGSVGTGNALKAKAVTTAMGIV